MQIQIPSELFEVLNYIAIGLISIACGFIAAGRDGLLYDIRVERGLHRVSWTVLFYSFSIYSILLSISQWNIGIDCGQEVTITNQTTSSVLVDGCGNLIVISMWLWIALLFLDSIYITVTISQRDFRKESSLKDQNNTKRSQRKQFFIAFIILIIRAAIHAIRFVIMVIAVPLSAATFINVFLCLCILFNVIIHGRALSLYNHIIQVMDSKNVIDVSAKQTVVIDDIDTESETESSSDEDSQSQMKLISNKSRQSGRPPQKIKRDFI
jgi:hypothetical protein